MATDDRLLLELQRRVLEDPASDVFAELAEEYRRIGRYNDAIATCRKGLATHPNHLAARVTLGRALVEVSRLDEAFTELTGVLDAVPGNLPAIRALAEIYQRRGLMSEALVHYRRALQLAQEEKDREAAAARVSEERVSALFDFDSLLAQLGPASPPAAAPIITPPSQDRIPELSPRASSTQPDAFELMEQQLRQRLDEQQAKAQEEQMARARELQQRQLAALGELEHWLSAIVADRQATQPSA